MGDGRALPLEQADDFERRKPPSLYETSRTLFYAAYDIYDRTTKAGATKARTGDDADVDAADDGAEHLDAELDYELDEGGEQGKEGGEGETAGKGGVDAKKGVADPEPDILDCALDCVLDSGTRGGADGGVTSGEARADKPATESAETSLAALTQKATGGDASAFPKLTAALLAAGSDSDSGREALDFIARRALTDETSRKALLSIADRSVDDRTRVIDSTMKAMKADTTGRGFDMTMLPTMAALALNDRTILDKPPAQIVDTLKDSAKGGNKESLLALSRIACARHQPTAKSDSIDGVTSETGKRAAQALQDLTPTLGKKQVFNAAAKIYSSYAPDSALNPESNYLINAIVNIRGYNQSSGKPIERSPEPGKTSLSALHEMLNSLDVTSDTKPRGYSHGINVELAPMLARLSTGAVDEKSARVAADKLGRMWLKGEDRLSVYSDVRKSFIEHGDKFGHGARALSSVATADKIYDFSDFQKHRAEMQADLRKVFDETATARGAEFASRSPSDPARGQDLTDHFSALGSRELMDHLISKKSGSVETVLPKELIDTISKMSKETQDELFAASPLLERLAKSGNHHADSGPADLARLVGLADAVKRDKGLSTEDKAAFKEFIDHRVLSVLGPSDFARGVRDALPKMDKQSREKALDMVRLAHRLETPEGARAATPDQVRGLAKYSIDNGITTAADRPLATVLSHATNQQSKELSFEYFRLFGWGGESPDKEFVKNSVKAYAKDYIKAHPNDHQFIHDASRLVDVGTKLPLPVLMRQLGIDHDNPEIKKGLEAAVEKVGEDRVRRALTNLTAWDALNPTLRGALAYGMDRPAVTKKDFLGELESKGTALGGLSVNDLLASLAGKKEARAGHPDVAALVASPGFSRKLKDVGDYFESARKLLERKVEVEAKGMDTSMRSLVRTASEGPGFFDGSKFETDQTKSTREVREAAERARTLSLQLAQVGQHLNRLDLATRVNDYGDKVSLGRRKDADATALDMVKKHGLTAVRNFAPDVYADIYGIEPGVPLRTAADTGVIGRLRRDGDSSSRLPIPDFTKTGTDTAWGKGLSVLGSLKGDSAVLTQPTRDSAVDLMLTDSRFRKVMETMTSLSRTQQEFNALFPIGTAGKRSEGLTTNMRILGAKMSADLDRLTSPENMKGVSAMLAELKDSDHPETKGLRDSLMAIKAMQDDWVKKDDRGKQNGKVHAMLEHVKSGDFDANNWGNWFKNNAGYLLLEAGITAGLMMIPVGGQAAGAARIATWGGRIAQTMMHAGRLTVSMAVADAAVKEIKHGLGGSPKGHMLGDATRAAMYGRGYQVDGHGHVVLAPTFEEATKETAKHLRDSYAMNLRMGALSQGTAGVLNRMRPGMTEALKQLESIQSSLDKAPGSAKLAGKFFSNFMSQNIGSLTHGALAGFLGHHFKLNENDAGVWAAHALAVAGGVKAHRSAAKALDHLQINHTGSNKDLAAFLKSNGKNVVEEAGGKYFLIDGKLKIQLVEATAKREAARDTARDTAGATKGQPRRSVDQPAKPRAETADKPAIEPPPKLTIKSQGPYHRDIEIEGNDGSKQTVSLYARGHWLEATDTKGVGKESPVKVHVSVQSAADLAKLQPVVVEALLKDPTLRQLVGGWKTMDPRYTKNGDPAAKPHGAEPTGIDQGAKGFTIYCGTPEHARQIQARLSEILAKNGLSLPTPINSGNVDSVDSRTNRVGLVRDTWPQTADSGGRRASGYLLDAELNAKIHESYGGRFLTQDDRRALETKLGLKANTLTYDSDHQLMLRAGRVHHYNKALYAYEDGVDKTKPLVDRPALYRLYNHYNLDPGQLAK